MADEVSTSTRRRCVVSRPMADLRRTQELLNRYFRGAEIAYLYLKHHLPLETDGPYRRAAEALNYLPAQAWYKKDRVMPHYNHTLGGLIEDVDRGLEFVYRSAIIYFCAAFDAYLEWRLKPLVAEERKAKKRKDNSTDVARSASYVSRLDRSAITRTALRPSLVVVLQADLCRYVRNVMVHEPHHLPTSVNDKAIVGWLDSTVKAIEKATGWPDKEEVTREVILDKVVRFMIERAEEERTKAKLEMRPIPPLDYLYAIFIFANLNRLAFRLDQLFLTPADVDGLRAAYERKAEEWEDERDATRKAGLEREVYEMAINADPREIVRDGIDIGEARQNRRQWPDAWPPEVRGTDGRILGAEESMSEGGR